MRSSVCGLGTAGIALTAALTGCGGESSNPVSAAGGSIEFPDDGSTLVRTMEPGVGSTTFYGSAAILGDSVVVSLDGFDTDVGNGGHFDVNLDTEGRAETITFGAHGAAVCAASGNFDFTWSIDGIVVHSGIDVSPVDPAAFLRDDEPPPELTNPELFLHAAEEAKRRARFLCFSRPEYVILQEMLEADETFMSSAIFVCAVESVTYPRMANWIRSQPGCHRGLWDTFELCVADGFAETDCLHCQEVLRAASTLDQLLKTLRGVMWEISGQIRQTPPDPCPDTSVDTFFNVVARLFELTPRGLQIEFQSEYLAVEPRVYCGSGQGDDCLSVAATSGPTGNALEEDALGLLIQPDLQAPGAHPFVYDEGGILYHNARLAFRSHQFTNEASGTPALLEASGGTFTLQEFGTTSGAIVTGTIDAQIHGVREVGGVFREVTGTINGAFSAQVP